MLLLGADHPPFLFEQISNKQGLNQNTITSVVQDKTGFIWMGTPNGLIKYDGSSFTLYNHHLSDPTSLLNNLVLEVFEDTKENLWIATTEGLCLYQPNTNDFLWIDEINQYLPENIKNFKIVESPDGGLWISTVSGLYVLREKEGAKKNFVVDKVTINENGQSVFPKHINFYTVHLLPDATVLVGTNLGLYHLKQAANGRYVKLNYFNPKPKERFIIKTILSDENGLIWIGSSTKLHFLKVSTTKEGYEYNWEARPLYYSEKLSLEGVNISCLFSNQQYILIGTQNSGLFSYTKDEGVINQYRIQEGIPNSISSDKINDIIIDKSGVLWLATGHGGINKIDTNNKPFFNLSAQYFDATSLSSNLISGLIIDSKKRLWAGTYQQGINISKQDFSLGTIYQTAFEHHLADFTIACLYETSEQLMLIGAVEGLKIYDINKDVFVKLAPTHPINAHLKSKTIQAIIQIDKEIWIATSTDLIKVTVENSSLDLLSGDFTYELFDGLKSLVSSPNIGISVFLHDPLTGLWVGSKNGVFLIKNRNGSLETEQFRQEINNNQSISNNNIFSLLKDHQNNCIWVGTFGGGLNQIVLNNLHQVTDIKRITSKDGLFNNAIYSILKDAKGVLWLSTDEGIERFDLALGTSNNYNMADGLYANNFRKNSYLALEDGTIIMGGLMGLTVFDPSSIAENPFSPSAIITNLKLFNQTINPNQTFQGVNILDKPIHKTESLTLPYNLNQLTFEFGAMHYATPNKNSFQYMLEGVDNNWITVGNEQRFANYAQLNPGDYIFKLKSFNGDGLANEGETTLQLTIQKPFYYSNLAFLLYALLLGILGYFLFRYLNYVLQLRRRVAEEERTIKHIQEINEAKLKFFTDISHEFRTPLTLIISPLERVINHPKLHPDLKELVLNINENGQKLLNLTNTLIDFRKVEEGVQKLVVTKNDLGLFIKKTAKAFHDYAIDRKITLTVNIPNEAFIGWFDPAIVERILFNLLSNAFKYTNEGGEVIVSMDLLENKTAIITVSDTGKGMPETEVKNIFERFFQGDSDENLFGSSGIGLSLVKKLIELHQGEISLSSEVDKGTNFEIRLPIGKESYLALQPSLANAEVSQDASLVNEVEEEPVAQITPKIGDNYTLLVVEDNVEVQKFIADIFSDTFTILQAENGVEGFKIATEQTPDIIISDLMMPKMDGFQLSTKLKEDIRTSHIPLVLLTALIDFESQKTAFEKGGDIYITKPFSPKLIKLQINNLLSTKKKESTFHKKNLIMKPVTEVVDTVDEVFLQKIKEILEANYSDTDLAVHTLAKETHMSYIQFYRKFKSLTGINAKEYIRTFRLKKAATIFQNDPKKAVNEVMYSVGFSSQSYFTAAFKKEYGMTPVAYKKKGKLKKE